jgi:hypothetical protein
MPDQPESSDPAARPVTPGRVLGVLLLAWGAWASRKSEEELEEEWAPLVLYEDADDGGRR